MQIDRAAAAEREQGDGNWETGAGSVVNSEATGDRNWAAKPGMDGLLMLMDN